MNKVLSFSVVVLTVALLTGCAKVPQEAIDSTSVMIEDAQTQEADVFAPEMFSAARDSFEAAQTEIELQNGKFALTRNYEAAERMLASAGQLAREATEAGVIRKQEMRAEAETMLIQAKETAAEAQLLLTKAPRGKEGRIALVAIGSDVDSLSTMFVEVEELLQQGNVKAAHDRVQATLSRAQGLTEELRQAIDKTSSKGRG